VIVLDEIQQPEVHFGDEYFSVSGRHLPDCFVLL